MRGLIARMFRRRQHEAVRLALGALLKEYIADRDCYYEASTDSLGRFHDEDDRRELRRMDALIDQCRAALWPGLRK